jgi:hypothetical protein
MPQSQQNVVILPDNRQQQLATPAFYETIGVGYRILAVRQFLIKGVSEKYDCVIVS